MAYEITCADVMDWAAEYDGEPFHAAFWPSNIVSCVGSYGRRHKVPAGCLAYCRNVQG